ncbi:hypothetical protein ACU4GA_04635 [Methylobacterium oryzae CBMB20]
MQIRIVLAFGALTLGGGALIPAPAQAYQLDTVNLVGCAQEGGVCRMPYPTNVYYGVPGRTNGRPFPQGGVVPCNSRDLRRSGPRPGEELLVRPAHHSGRRWWWRELRWRGRLRRWRLPE